MFQKNWASVPDERVWLSLGKYVSNAMYDYSYESRCRYSFARVSVQMVILDPHF